MKWMMRWGVLALVLLCAGCMDAGHGVHVDGVQVERPWSRAIPPDAPVAAGFLTVHNGSGVDDRLVSVRSDAAERVEIHEIRHEGGMARMRELADGLRLPTGNTVELKPGGYHLMFIAPGGGFVAGNHVEATLVFEHAGEVAVSFEVRAVGATGATEPSHAGH